MTPPMKQRFVITDNHKLNMQLAQMAEYRQEVEKQTAFVADLFTLSAEMVAILNKQKKYHPIVDRWMRLVKDIHP